MRKKTPPAELDAGDPAAKSTFEVLARTFADEVMKSEAAAKLWERVTGRGPDVISGDWPYYAPSTGTRDLRWYMIVGASAYTLRQEALKHAAKKQRGKAVGVIRTRDGLWHVLSSFRSLDEADDWFGAVTVEPHDFEYAAYFDRTAGGLSLEAEKLGSAGGPVTTIARDAIGG